MAENPTIPGNSESVQFEEKPQKNLIRDFFGIITDPTKAFKNILSAGYWVGIFIVILIVAAGLEQIYHAQVVKVAVDKIAEQAASSGQDMQTAIDFYENQAISRPLYMFFTIAGHFVMLLIGAILYFFLCSVIFGGTAKFKQVWIITVWASVIYLIDMIIKTPLILAKDSIHAGLNFGLLFSEEMVGAKLHNGFGALDIFGIWHFIVMGLGLAVLYKFSTKKGIGISFIVWLVMTAVGFIAAYVS